MSNQKPGEIVDVKTVKLGKLPGRETPRIVGAPEVSETPPTTLDSRSPVKPQEVEVKQHLEAVTVREHVRAKPRKKDEPEIRLRSMNQDERRAWERAKRAED